MVHLCSRPYFGNFCMNRMRRRMDILLRTQQTSRVSTMVGAFEEIACFVADGILVQKIKSKNTGLTIIKADVEGSSLSPPLLY